MSAVLLVAPMPISRQRTGPAIRYWEFARVLSAEEQVTLLVPNEDHPSHRDFSVCTSTEDDLDALLASHQIIVVQGPALQKHPRLVQILATGQHYLVVDLYDPITLEQLEIDRGGKVGPWLHLEYASLLSQQLRLGDFFLCATERQRDYWLGALAALGRVNHETYDGADMRRLIDVVPFGLPAQPPQRSRPVLKGVLAGIASDDRLIVWGGGVWDWLDPLTPIRAMERVGVRHPSARLVFFEADRYRSTMLHRAKELAAEMGLLGRHVLLTGWLSQEQWGGCLQEADVGLSFHPASIETHFAFRTRLLDYIWAGLPIVTAGGDVLSNIVASHGLGHVVEPGDAEALSKALIALLDEPQARSSRREAFRKASEQFVWERVTQPLAAYCRQPWHAGDRDDGFHPQWQAAQREHILARAAHAERRLAETQAQALEQTAHLQGQVDDLSQQLRRSKAQLEEAMGGRVMRLMTGIQRALRGDGG